MTKKIIKRIILWLIAVPVLLFTVVLTVVYFKQDAIVQSQIETLNTTYKGKISVGDVHLAPFTNFPFISLKIDDIIVQENKEKNSSEILNVSDIYLSFSIWDILDGNHDIQSILIEDGFFDLVIHPDGTINVQNALATASEEDNTNPLEIHLKEIELKNLDIHKRQEATNLDVESFIYWAKGGFNTLNDKISAHVDSELELNVIDNGDTTYIKHKHFEFHTDFIFDNKSGTLDFKPSGITMEHGDFDISGSIDTEQDMTLDLDIKGTNPSFDLFIAFAPEELIPVLERYDNEGDIYFNAIIQGPTTKGRQPFIDVKFGASEAYLENNSEKKRIKKMGFSGHFTNGGKRDLSTMEFSINDMTADIDKGNILGSVLVKNFEAPEIDMTLDADFDIDFIASFLNLEDIQDARGNVVMHLKFHDIIDLEHPEHALNDLNKAYFAELNIKDLNFTSESLIAPVQDLNAHLIMNGKKAELVLLDFIMGNSNLAMSGFLSDLPAIIHHASTPVHSQLKIESKLVDIAELTNFSAKDSTGIDEQIENLSLAFSFNALGNAFTEFKHIPLGEFFIDDLYADLKHYPHTLHDFHADVMIKDDDLNILDFTGIIDASDFHFNGLIHDYSFWMQDELNGDVDLDIMLKSDMLKLEDLFAYKNENYVPDDYKHEEIDNLKLHLKSSMHYIDSELKSIDLNLDHFNGKMHVHPLRFEDFKGRFHYEDEHLMVQNFHGKMGETIFDIDMNYYLGEDEAIKKRDNLFKLKSNYIDFDALTNFNLEPPHKRNEKKEDAAHNTEDTPEHSSAFNLYELPFSDMAFNIDIDHFIHHRLDFKKIKGQFRITHNHYIYMDQFSLDAAGGHLDLSGYFNGSDPTHIYLKPDLKIKNMDLDKLLFKFENFGQDEIVSDYVHGQLNANITGKIRVYPDLIPDLDQSEVHLDVKILNGRLENYSPVMMLSDYFGDSDLKSIRFDTLQNHMDITNGKITLPKMNIESNLGHLEISGTQDMDDKINYFVRIPWSLIKQASRNKLFGVKEVATAKENEIIELDPKKKTRYLNLNIFGTFDDYSIKIKKNKI